MYPECTPVHVSTDIRSLDQDFFIPEDPLSQVVNDLDFLFWDS